MSMLGPRHFAECLQLFLQLHAELSWIEETAIRRRAEMASPQGGDRRSEDFNVTKCNVETVAERMNLSRARERIRNIM